MQHDETLDYRIRQALDRLPDAPPPGSAFDAARLWDQLRPELAALPADVPATRTSQRTRWWAVAAVLAALLAGLGWWNLSSKTANSVAITAKRTVPPRVQGSTVQSTYQQSPIAETSPIRQRTRQRTYPAPKASKQHAISPEATANVPTELLTDVPAPNPPDANVPAPTLKPVQPTSAVAARKPTRATYLRRGFRVVHENDLLTDEEVQLTQQPLPKHTDRAEPFVRIGQRSGAENTMSTTVPETAAPRLHIPLSRKPIQ